jgi:hypothetical protein
MAWELYKNRGMKMITRNVDLYPNWKNAVRLFIEAEFKYEQLIPHSWFILALGMKKPDDNATFEDGIKFESEYRNQMEMVKKELLREHNIYIENKYGDGYYIIPPEKQTKAALDDMFTSLNKRLNKARRILKYTNIEALNYEQKRENTDAQVKVSMLKRMLKPKKVDYLIETKLLDRPIKV